MDRQCGEGPGRPPATNILQWKIHRRRDVNPNQSPLKLLDIGTENLIARLSLPLPLRLCHPGVGDVIIKIKPRRKTV